MIRSRPSARGELRLPYCTPTQRSEQQKERHLPLQMLLRIQIAGGLLWVARLCVVCDFDVADFLQVEIGGDESDLFFTTLQVTIILRELF